MGSRAQSTATSGNTTCNSCTEESVLYVCAETSLHPLNPSLLDRLTDAVNVVCVWERIRGHSTITRMFEQYCKCRGLNWVHQETPSAIRQHHFPGNDSRTMFILLCVSLFYIHCVLFIYICTALWSAVFKCAGTLPCPHGVPTVHISLQLKTHGASWSWESVDADHGVLTSWSLVSSKTGQIVQLAMQHNNLHPQVPLWHDAKCVSQASN